jgi:hypothetical protein
VLAHRNVLPEDLALLQLVDEPSEVCRIVGAAAAVQGLQRRS